MSLTSDEVNFLVYRYLLESGFVHSAFSFAHESYVSRSSIDSSAVPPGALISFVQKGLQYVEIESHINADGTESICDEGFTVIHKHECNVKKRKRVFEPYEAVEADLGPLELDSDLVMLVNGHSQTVFVCQFAPSGSSLITGSADGTARMFPVRSMWEQDDGTAEGEEAFKVLHEHTVLHHAQGKEGDSEAFDPAKHKPQQGKDPNNNNNNNNDNNDKQGDSSKNSSSNKKQKAATPSAMDVQPGPHSVVAAGWNANGGLVATATYGGQVMVWNGRTGALTHRLATLHEGPVTCLAWSQGRGGKRLATGGVDGVVVVWDAQTGKMVQKYKLGSPVLSVQWPSGSDERVAASSVDGHVRLLEPARSNAASKTLRGHEGECNMVCWSRSGTRLASCSDDKNVLIWEPDAAKGSEEPVKVLAGHQRAVVALAWSNVGAGCNNKTHELLATASLDTTVKLWDVEQGDCVRTLRQHAHPVTALAFSPNGEWLATGSHDRIHIWRADDGEMVRTYRNASGVNQLSWARAGKKLAACFVDNTVRVIHVEEAEDN